jgi:hypothetical protein
VLLGLLTSTCASVHSFAPPRFAALTGQAGFADESVSEVKAKKKFNMYEGKFGVYTHINFNDTFFNSCV